MTIQLIRLGDINAGNGDPLRTAFEKVNANFAELYSNPISGTISTGTTPPTNPSVGSLWYDENGGRLYVFYDHNWVDSSPVPAPDVISKAQLKSIVAASTSFSDFQARIAAI